MTVASINALLYLDRRPDIELLQDFNQDLSRARKLVVCTGGEPLLQRCRLRWTFGSAPSCRMSPVRCHRLERSC